MKTKIAVLASGGGSNLQALLDAWKSGQFDQAEIALVISNKEHAKALERAKKCNVDACFLDPKAFDNRTLYDEALVKLLKTNNIDFVCLAGYMRILTSTFVENYQMKILNIHPALLPAFGGEGMYGCHVHEAVIASGVKYSGCTVHFVDEGTDTGPIVLQSVVPVMDHDKPEDLAERILIEEHRLFPRAVSLLCENRLKVDGNRVSIQEKA